MSRRTGHHTVLLFNKPYGVLCQFTDELARPTLADYIQAPGFYAAGRLDRDSEGLLVLTNDGRLQQRISDPVHKLDKEYLVQVDGDISASALEQLRRGIVLKDGKAKAFNVRKVDQPDYLWPREPPVRFRKTIPTSWMQLSLKEGRNRQVRRMCAAVGFPTLRLIRTRIGNCSIQTLAPGDQRYVTPDDLLGRT